MEEFQTINIADASLMSRDVSFVGETQPDIFNTSTDASSDDQNGSFVNTEETVVKIEQAKVPHSLP